MENEKKCAKDNEQMLFVCNIVKAFDSRCDQMQDPVARNTLILNMLLSVFDFSKAGLETYVSRYDRESQQAIRDVIEILNKRVRDLTSFVTNRNFPAVRPA
jgi:hypothetical protein